ncbi:hypothetical protein AC628_33360 [Bradyrhizobium sp. NAS96.2]|nr:hypothetical protein AC628_33360 [Bradyrhizobium sp. NAS96.2]
MICSDADEIQVSILSFQYLWGNLPDADGKPMLSFLCAPLDFGRAVRDAAEAVLKKHGLADYNKKWGHDFPSQELDLLQSYIVAWERNKR